MKSTRRLILFGALLASFCLAWGSAVRAASGKARPVKGLGFGKKSIQLNKRGRQSATLAHGVVTGLVEPEAARLSIEPSDVFVKPGAVIRFAAVGFTDSLKSFTPRRLTWSTTGGHMNPKTGRFVAGSKPGTYEVTVEGTRKRARAFIRIVSKRRESGGSGAQTATFLAGLGGKVKLQTPHLHEVCWEAPGVPTGQSRVSVSCVVDHVDAHRLALVAHGTDGSVDEVETSLCRDGDWVKLTYFFTAMFDSIDGFGLILYDRHDHVLYRTR